jgi:hypothetical protein
MRRRSRRKKKCRRQCGTLHLLRESRRFNSPEWFQAVRARPSSKDRLEARLSVGR